MQRSAQDDGSEVRTVKLLTFLIFESDLPSFFGKDAILPMALGREESFLRTYSSDTYDH